MLQGRKIEGDVPASNRAIEIRRRKREICNIVHNSTWVIETSMLSFHILLEILALRIEPYILHSISDTIGGLCTRLVVPFTFLFAEQRIKVIVMEHGWISAIKDASKLKNFSRVEQFDGNLAPIALSRNQRHASQSTSQQNVNFRSRRKTDFHCNNNSSKVEKSSLSNPEIHIARTLNHENIRIPGSVEEHVN